ncbi:MAG: penicillin acylase family protein, partial [Gammaproteobacteria bacterium]
MKRALIGLGICIIVLVLVVTIGGTVFLRGSAPQLDGSVKLAELSAPVTVTRDDLGVPVITAANQLDLARTLGFLHAQDRFFQMDLM